MTLQCTNVRTSNDLKRFLCFVHTYDSPPPPPTMQQDVIQVNNATNDAGEFDIGLLYRSLQFSQLNNRNRMIKSHRTVVMFLHLRAGG
jgi:hypothetical protein